MDDIALVRLYVNDPDDGQPDFEDGTIQSLLDLTGDAHGAASELWSIRAANVFEYYSVQLDGGLLSRQQVWDHCMKMVDFHSQLSENQIESILMDGGSSPDDTASEF